MSIDEGSPNPKATRLQHPFGDKNKACVILYCLDSKSCPHQRMTYIQYNIFIVDDLSSVTVDDGFPCVSPTFQIDCGLREAALTDAFCVLGETLYMFEGCVDDEGGQSVFAIDLTQTLTLTQETRKLEKGGPLLKKIGDMQSPKAAPVALPMPNGEKILVFPTMQRDRDGFTPLELFEPATRSWEQLPSIPGRRNSVGNSVEAYGFIDKSCRLLIQMMFSEIYVLDLASPDKHWVEVDDASAFYSGLDHIPPHIPCPSFFEAFDGRRFCLVNLFGFCDLEEYVAERRPEEFKPFTFSAPNTFNLGMPRGLRADCCVSLLNYGGKECHFCELTVERPSQGYAESCRLEIAVCRVNLESYKETMEQHFISKEAGRWSSMHVKDTNTTVIRTHKFTLGFGESCKVYAPHLFFTF